MSNRRDLETQIHSLGEIKEIMNAMKNISLMETHRLSRFLDTQHRVVRTIELAATDFLSFHANLLAGEENLREATLLLGSERGFCGDFNEALIKTFDSQRTGDEKATEQPATLVVIGEKLTSKLAGDPRVAASLGGASVVEEIEAVLAKVIDALNRLHVTGSGDAPLRLTVLHHDPDQDRVQVSFLTPFKQPESANFRFTYEPELNLDSSLFLSGLAEQYLIARLQDMLYRSLMAENQRRMQHMDSAVRLLERTAKQLWQRRNIVRQEEITEEIEIIMLSVAAFN